MESTHNQQLGSHLWGPFPTSRLPPVRSPPAKLHSRNSYFTPNIIEKQASINLHKHRNSTPVIPYISHPAPSNRTKLPPLVPPTVHLIRHGQGYNNLPTTPASTIDPLLTPLGESQCRALAHAFPHHASLGAIFASPLRRTLQTALIGFESETRAGMSIIALPEAQEISDFGADTGSDLQVLVQEVKGKPVDLSLVGEGWNSKTGKWAGTVAAVDARAAEVRRFLWGRGEGALVLVSHLGFLHYLTADWEGDVGQYTSDILTHPRKHFKHEKDQCQMELIHRVGSSWLNTEFRTYEFVEGDGGTLAMRETDASRHLRGATGPRLTEQEQMRRRERKLSVWERLEAEIRAAERKTQPSQLPGPG